MHMVESVSNELLDSFTFCFLGIGVIYFDHAHSIHPREAVSPAIKTRSQNDHLLTPSCSA